MLQQSVVANSQKRMLFTYKNTTTPTSSRAAEELYTNYNALFTLVERLRCCIRGTTQVAGYKLLLFLYDGRECWTITASEEDEVDQHNFNYSNIWHIHTRCAALHSAHKRIISVSARTRTVLKWIQLRIANTHRQRKSALPKRNNTRTYSTRYEYDARKQTLNTSVMIILLWIECA